MGNEIEEMIKVLDRLIRLLIEESPEYRRISVPRDLDGKKNLFRALCNVRPPMPVSGEFLELEGIYLKGELEKKGVTDGELLKMAGPDAMILWKGDITTLKADAIVNAANGGLTGCYVPCHRCIDNAIHSAAGVSLRLECSRLMERENGGRDEPVGRAKITSGGYLPCRHVIHTVGPCISGHVTEQDRRDLASCYRSCMETAEANGLHSIAFCCISTGEFRFPAEEAAQIAVETVREEIQRSHHVIRVIFNVFSERDLAIYQRLLAAQDHFGGGT